MINQFKQIVNELPDVESKIEQPIKFEEKPNLDEYPLVGTSLDSEYIQWLTPSENRELEGAFNPPQPVLPESRRGDNGALHLQADYSQEVINKTEEQIDKSTDLGENIELQERISGLEEARDKVIEKREIEEVREQQFGDISRLGRFKEWAKENIVGISAIAISIGGFTTTIIFGTRKSTSRGAQATGKFAKSVYNLGKKLGGLIAPLFRVAF